MGREFDQQVDRNVSTYRGYRVHPICRYWHLLDKAMQTERDEMQVKKIGLQPLDVSCDPRS